MAKAIYGYISEEISPDPKALATTASTIVEKLRKAQRHHREVVLP